MASRSYPGWVVGVLAAIAVGGWITAWSNRNAPEKHLADQKAENVGSKGLTRTREVREKSPLSFIQDGDTARLLASFPAIHAAAVPGEVNQKLLHACRMSLLDGNVNRRAQNFGLLLQLMRPEDGPALHEQFLELHREGKTYDEYKVMAHRWGELDATGAIQYITSQKPLVFPPDDFRAIVRGWAQKNPEAALQWMDGNPEMAIRMNGRAAVLEGWIREDPQIALKWLDSNLVKMNGRDYVEAVRVAFTNQITGGGSGADDALDWLTSRPDHDLAVPASIMAWQSIQWTFGEMPYDKAAAVWGKVGGQQWMDFQQFGHFCHVISQNRVADQGAAGFLTALEKTWPADQVTSQFDRWTRSDPKAITDWLEGAPPSAVTRAAIEGAIKALGEMDPDAAALWTSRLEDY